MKKLRPSEEKKDFPNFSKLRSSYTKVTLIKKICSFTRGVHNNTFASSKNRKEQQNNLPECLN